MSFLLTQDYKNKPLNNNGTVDHEYLEKFLKPDKNLYELMYEQSHLLDILMDLESPDNFQNFLKFSKKTINKDPNGSHTTQEIYPK